jgi:RNase P subunit RPR2
MINYIMKNTDKLVCIQYDISKRFSNLASAIQERMLYEFPAAWRRCPSIRTGDLA